MSMFSKEDLLQIEKHGLTLQAVERQIENFRNGFPYLKIVRAASAGDGVRVLDEDETQRAVARYETAAGGLRVVKFVPASGAATRMFKALFEFVNEGRRSRAIDELLANIDRFAFGRRLRELDQKVPLIFLTDTSQYAVMGVRLHLTDYVVKPAEFKHLVRALKLAGIGNGR